MKKRLCLYVCIAPGTEEISREQSSLLQLIQLFLLLTPCVPIKAFVFPPHLHRFLYKVHKNDCPPQLVV